MKYFMRQTLFMLLISLSSCLHRKEPAPAFNCANSSKLSFTDIQPILTHNCSYSGCHDSSNPSIPSLLTLQEVKNNSADCTFQIDHGAMPPTPSLAFSDFDKAKLLCWLNNGAN